MTPPPSRVLTALAIAWSLNACAASGPYRYAAEPLAFVSDTELAVVISQAKPRRSFVISGSRGPHRERTWAYNERLLLLSLDSGTCAWHGESLDLAESNPPRTVDRLERTHVVADRADLLRAMDAACDGLVRTLEDTLRHDAALPLVALFRDGFLLALYDRDQDQCLVTASDPVLHRVRRFYDGRKPGTLLAVVSQEQAVAFWEIEINTLARTLIASIPVPARSVWSYEHGDPRARVWHVDRESIWLHLADSDVSVLRIRRSDERSYPLTRNADPTRDAVWPVHCLRAERPPVGTPEGLPSATAPGTRATEQP